MAPAMLRMESTRPPGVFSIDQQGGGVFGVGAGNGAVELACGDGLDSVGQDEFFDKRLLALHTKGRMRMSRRARVQAHRDPRIQPDTKSANAAHGLKHGVLLHGLETSPAPVAVLRSP